MKNGVQPRRQSREEGPRKISGLVRKQFRALLKSVPPLFPSDQDRRPRRPLARAAPPKYHVIKSSNRPRFTPDRNLPPPLRHFPYYVIRRERMKVREGGRERLPLSFCVHLSSSFSSSFCNYSFLRTLAGRESRNSSTGFLPSCGWGVIEKRGGFGDFENSLSTLVFPRRKHGYNKCSD